MLRALYCFQLNALHSIQELHFLIKGFEFHAHLSKSPTFAKLFVLRDPSLFSSFDFLPSRVLFSPFSTFRSQNYVPLYPLFSRTSNRVLFNWWGAFRCARTYRFVFFFCFFSIYSSSIVERLFLRRFSTFRVNSSNIVPLSWQ